MSRVHIFVACLLMMVCPSLVFASPILVEVLPSNPGETDTVLLDATLEWPTSGYSVFESSVTFVSDFEFEVDVIVLAPAPGSYNFQVITSEVSRIDLGLLPAGTYVYTINESQSPGHPWGGPIGPYSSGGTLSGSFEVIPEPTTLSMLALGGLMVLRRKRS